MPYPVPTDHERCALFAWLKQASSLTAWRRLYSHQQVFVDAVESVYEQEQTTPGMAQTIFSSWYSGVLKSHDAFAAGLARLQGGDRRCFDFLGARGHFSEGLKDVKWWEDMYGGSFSGRNGFGPEASPRWPEIEQAMHDCLAALSDIGVVLQKQHTDVPAPIFRTGVYHSNPHSSLFKHWFSQAALPAVPVATPEVLVPTGKVISCYGVWEPVRVASRSIFRGSSSPPLAESRIVDGRELDGCLNYLHGDSAAPTIAFPEDGQRREGRPTTWRLVWRDERYGPQPIPDEEKDYVFVRPVPGEVLFRYG